jgi:peptidoglycan/xylan/chitin deacetylase (PgdA/CDA1 family)
MDNARPSIPILLYHKIGRPPRGARVPGHYVSPRLFVRHLDYLLRHGYSTISLLDVQAVSGRRPPIPRPVVITFDDGYECLYEHALPALSERGMTATVFLVTSGIGGSNVWEQAVGDVAEPMLSLSEIAEMREQGLEFGSHTLSHAHLTLLSEADAQHEISASRHALEQALGERCRTFAYPYGEWNQRVRDMVQQAGYEVACTTVRAAALPGDDPMALPRINIRRYNVVPRFAYKLWRAGQSRQ